MLLIMKNRFFEGAEDMHKGSETYSKYQELGGIINEKDYTGVLARADKSTAFKESLLIQARNIAKHAAAYPNMFD